MPKYLKVQEEIASMVVNHPRPIYTPKEFVETAAEIRVKGTVQGVGFRPMVYQLAQRYELRGEVYNDAKGVIIRIAGPPEYIDCFTAQLQRSAPPLAKIDSIEKNVVAIASVTQPTFEITPSRTGQSRTQISPDAATCPQCLSDLFNPRGRFYHYPFTNCTHCGPRLSIIRAIPYDRANTSMAAFSMCSDCQAEYTNPLNRRFHAQPVACSRCGPQVWIEGAESPQTSVAQLFPIDKVCTLIQRGEIIAIKGIGGIHLACDATNEDSVRKLRDRKHRYHKPFALMARDVSVIARYCNISRAERALLESPAAPIVLLQRKQLTSYDEGLERTQPLSSPEFSTPLSHALPLATSVSPNLPTLGVMLPYTPLHHLIMKGIDFPIVLTSGNLSDEPQCIDNDEAQSKLSSIATYFLLHNRDIVNRVDDSVVRIVQGQKQTLRRARGYAPASIRLPSGFEDTPPILAMGSELKSTFCLSRSGEAILSQHLGNLENMAAFEAYQEALRLYHRLFEHESEAIAVDLHPDYLSTKLGKDLAQQKGIPLYGIQHHHAHMAAVMIEHELSIDTSPVLGIVLDGLGYGNDDSLWGGEFLIADYQRFERVAHFEAIAMLGGAQATRQPWRNTYAQLMKTMGWKTLTTQFGDLELLHFLSAQPRSVLDHMLETGIRSPLASSAGRLFDAVAASVGCCREGVSYEGQGAIELEALIHPDTSCDDPYPFATEIKGDRLVLSSAPMWQNLLQDLQRGVEPPIIATRFHYGLAAAIANLAIHLTQVYNLTQVVLSGGVFQNQVLQVAVHTLLEQADLLVLIPHDIPPNDGGIALGQVAIAAARHRASLMNP